jgi:hypothetical protein
MAKADASGAVYPMRLLGFPTLEAVKTWSLGPALYEQYHGVFARPLRYCGILETLK